MYFIMVMNHTLFHYKIHLWCWSKAAPGGVGNSGGNSALTLLETLWYPCFNTIHLPFSSTRVDW